VDAKYHHPVNLGLNNATIAYKNAGKEHHNYG
jgi:hypothetical protein